MQFLSFSSVIIPLSTRGHAFIPELWSLSSEHHGSRWIKSPCTVTHCCLVCINFLVSISGYTCWTELLWTLLILSRVEQQTLLYVVFVFAQPQLDTISKLLFWMSWQGLIILEVKVADSVSNNTCLWWANNWGACEWVITTLIIVAAIVWSIPPTRIRGTFFILICCIAQDLSEV